MLITKIGKAKHYTHTFLTRWHYQGTMKNFKPWALKENAFLTKEKTY